MWSTSSQDLRKIFFHYLQSTIIMWGLIFKVFSSLYTRTYPQVLPRGFVQDPLNLPSVFVQATLKLTRAQVFEGLQDENKLSNKSKWEWNYTINTKSWGQKEYSRKLDFWALWMINQCNGIFYFVVKCHWRYNISLNPNINIRGIQSEYVSYWHPKISNRVFLLLKA